MASENLEALLALLGDVPSKNVGHVTPELLTATMGRMEAFRLSVKALGEAYESLPQRLHQGLQEERF